MSGELLNTEICVCFIIIIIELQFTRAVYSAIKSIFKFKFNFIIKPNDRPIFVYFFSTAFVSCTLSIQMENDSKQRAFSKLSKFTVAMLTL